MANNLDTSKSFKATCRKYLDSKGEKKTTASSLLKASQAYPPGYGRALAQKFNSLIVDDRDELVTLPSGFAFPVEEDPWEDAGLQAVLEYMDSC